MPEPAKIFVSYSRKDGEAAERLCNDLRERGFDVWFDKRTIKPGDEWGRRIQEDIRQCSHFVFLLTERPLAHGGYARRELEMALALQRSLPWGVSFIFPVRLTGEGVPLRWHDRTARQFQKYMWTDLSSDWDAGVDRLCEELRKRPEPVSKKTFFLYYLFGSASLLFPFYCWVFFKTRPVSFTSNEPIAEFMILAMCVAAPFALALGAAAFGSAVKTKTKLGAWAIGFFFAILALGLIASVSH